MTDLIPNFYDDMDDIDDNSMPLPPFDDEDDDDEFGDDYNDDFLENNRKSTVIYSRELDSKASNYSEGSLGVFVFHVYFNRQLRLCFSQIICFHSAARLIRFPAF